jgi:hypothetical protein
VAATLSLVCLSGCANGAGQKDDPYAAEFEIARQQTDDPELLKILADDEVTDAEYTQVQQLDIECVAEKGVKAWVDEEGYSHYENTGNRIPGEQFKAIVEECNERFTDLVGILYYGPRDNPDNTSGIEMLLKCFKKFHVVDDSMTVDQLYSADWNNPPWDRLSGDAYGCQQDPMNYKGGHPRLTPDEVPEWNTIEPDADGTVTVHAN